MEYAKNTKNRSILHRPQIADLERREHLSCQFCLARHLRFAFRLLRFNFLTFAYDAYSHFCLHLPAGWIHVGRTAKRPGTLSDCATSATATAAARRSVAADRARASSGSCPSPDCAAKTKWPCST